MQLGAVGLHLAASLLLPSAQGSPEPLTPSLRGRVVAEGSGEPVSGAMLTTFGFSIEQTSTTTAQDGTFAIPTTGLHRGVNASWEKSIDHVRIEAPGFAPLFLDPLASATWTDVIRLRPATVLRGTLKGASRGARASARIESLAWPPQSGLSCYVPPVEARFDELGRFEFPPLPTQVPIEIEFDTGWAERRSGALRDLVLEPGTERTLELDIATLAPIARPTSAESDEGWRAVEPVVLDAKDAAREWTWFEFVEGGRHQPHRVGGGSRHVHKNRPCTHLEARPGKWTLVARDPAGWIGVQEFTIADAEKVAKPTIRLAPGALLRIDASSSTAPARIELSAKGIVFCARKVLPGELRYELAPAGEVTVKVIADGKSAPDRSTTASQGSIVDLRL
jgi:hypothetical protein